MIETLAEHGNSWAIIIDKPILDLLKIGPEKPREVTTDGCVLTIGPVSDRKRAERFSAALAKTDNRYGCGKGVGDSGAACCSVLEGEGGVGRSSSVTGKRGEDEAEEAVVAA